MGLFGRRGASTQREEVPAESVVAPEEVAPERPEQGPWDRAHVDGPGSRIDLGAVWLPGVDGMKLRMDVDKATGKVAGVTVAVDETSLQVQAFAAPRTTGIWDEIREEIADSLRQQGAQVDDIVGPFGRELLARATFKDGEGHRSVRVIRFLGVDGPRWFLRGVINGPASIAQDGAAAVEKIFGDTVVVRDDAARAPRELLEMRTPEVRQRPTAPTSGEPTSDGPLTPPERGPEITQIG